jgi:hypothetical protein
MSHPTAFGYGEFSFTWGDHICAIFDDHLQQMEVMLPFMSEGLRDGQRCVWIAPASSCRSFRAALAEAGGDLPTLEASGQLVIIEDVEYYLENGIFEPERTMRLLRALLQDGQQHGYTTMRLTGDASWLQGRVDPQVWEEYELRVNDVIVDLPVVVVCQYNRFQTSGTMLVAALRTHPYVILGGAVHANPFYVPEASAGTPSIM